MTIANILHSYDHFHNNCIQEMIILEQIKQVHFLEKIIFKETWMSTTTTNIYK